MGVPFGFSSQEEYDRWVSDLHAATQKLEVVAKEAGKKQARILGEDAGDLFSSVSPVEIPQEILDVVHAAKTAAGFVPFLPLDGVDPNIKKVIEPIAKAVELLAAFLRVK
jgi:hypothetical protein